MKTIIRTFLTAIITLGLTIPRAHAGDEVWAAMGGFVAGVITGVAIENGNAHGNVSISVGHVPPAVYCHPHGRAGCDICCLPGPAGYWEVTHVRVWVPGYWEFSYSHCGDRIRVWRPGRYDHRPHRVWVTHRHPMRPAYPGHPAYGYGRNGRDYYKDGHRNDYRDNRNDDRGGRGRPGEANRDRPRRG